MTGRRLSRGERRFAGLFFPISFGFGGRLALVAFHGPLVRLFTQNGYLTGLLLAIGPLVATVAHPVFGRLSDRTSTRLGRRIPYALVGVPLTALVLFAIPSAGHTGWLLALFLLHALVASICSVPLLSLVPDSVDPRARGRVMSVSMIGTGLGAIAIQLVGKLVWESDFALVYYASAALLLVGALPPLFFLREGTVAPPPPVAGPSWWLETLRLERPLALFLLSASLRYLGTGLVMTYLTLFAATDLDIGVGDAALAIAASGLLRLALALPAGRLSDVYDRRRLLLAATWIVALAHLATGLLVASLWHLYAILGLAAAAGVLEMAAGGPLFMDLMPAERRGELMGVNLVLQNVLRGLGALAGGMAFAWTGSYRAVFPAAAACFALSALVLVRFPRSLQGSSPPYDSRHSRAPAGEAS